MINNEQFVEENFENFENSVTYTSLRSCEVLSKKNWPKNSAIGVKCMKSF